jgi:adenosylcobinamide-phosphate synthase
VPVVPNPDIAKLAALLSALAIDLVFGDPPNRYHPVAWIGRLLGAGQRWLCRGSPARLLVAGALTTIAVAGLAGAAAALVSRISVQFGIAGILLEALALAFLFSLRDLIGAARSIARDLDRGDLPAAREAVGYHLVSRPTAALDEGQVASATIESVAENLTDSLVAPVCFFLAGGLAWAAVYRVINTADSMLGFRRGPLEYFGKSAARLDDLVNLIPARLAGLSLVAGAALVGESPGGALAALRRDRRRTPSPNSGWPMSAMAGALGVVLEKPGVHRLGAGAPPIAADIERAVRVVAAASAVSVALAVSVFVAGALVLGPAR